MAGFCQVIATNPMELVKIRVQLEAALPKAEQQSTIKIIKELGFSGVYRGTCSTLMRDVPFSFIFFPLYSNLTKLFADKSGQTPLYGQLLAGCIAGGTGSACVTPADVIKTRLQMAGGKEKYGNIAGAFRTVLKEEGVGALFKGLFPRVAVVSPLFGITLMAFEFQKEYMRKHGLL